MFGGGPSCLTVPPGFVSKKWVIGCNYRPRNIKFNYHYLNDPLSVCWMYKNNVDPLISSLILSDVICNFHLFHQYKYKSVPDWLPHYFALNPNNYRDYWVGEMPIKEYLDALTIGMVQGKLPHYRCTCPCPAPYEKTPTVGIRWYNSGIFCIELAIYMGFKTIYLAGFDSGSSHAYEHYASDRIVIAKGRNDSFYQMYINKINELSKTRKLILVNCPDNRYKQIENISV